MPSSQEMKVQNTFDKAMDQINNLQKVFRDEGMLAKAVVDLGGSQDFGAIQEAFDNLYGALEDAHYDAMAHLEVESVKQKLGMTEDKSMKVNKEVDLAGDSIWDKEGENPAKVMVMSITMPFIVTLMIAMVSAIAFLQMIFSVQTLTALMVRQQVKPAWLLVEALEAQV